MVDILYDASRYSEIKQATVVSGLGCQIHARGRRD